MSNIDVVKILQIGIIGLGFLLALLAFWLLRNEQHKKESSERMLTAIRTFMFFSLVLCMIGIVPDVLKEFRSGDQKDQDIAEISERLATVTQQFGRTCEHIRTTNWLDKSSEARKSLSQWCN